MLKLFYSPGACSLAPHIVLEEIGKPYEKELVSTDPTKPGMTTVSAAWREINPKGRVPALLGVAGAASDKNILTEANAILLYLARKFPGAKLLPPTPEGEARALEWLNYVSGTIHGNSFAGIWRPARFVEDKALFPALEAHARKNLRDQFAIVEAQFADGRDWAVPGHHSIADSYVLVVYRWGNRVGMDMASLYPAWTRHTERMIARPAVAKAFQDEGIGLT